MGDFSLPSWKKQETLLCVCVTLEQLETTHAENNEITRELLF